MRLKGGFSKLCDTGLVKSETKLVTECLRMTKVAIFQINQEITCQLSKSLLFGNLTLD